MSKIRRLLAGCARLLVAVYDIGRYPAVRARQSREAAMVPSLAWSAAECRETKKDELAAPEGRLNVSHLLEGRGFNAAVQNAWVVILKPPKVAIDANHF